MDLNGWTGKTYTNPPAWVALRVRLGAKKFRCEYCRLNFASFRSRKEVFTFKRWKRFGNQAEDHSAGPQGVEGEVIFSPDQRVHDKGMNEQGVDRRAKGDAGKHPDEKPTTPA
jgi:hypothetical protein